MIAKVPVEDVKKKILEQTGPVPPAVHQNLAQAQTAYVQVKEAVMDAHSQAYEPLNKAAVGVIDGFERAVPSHKGMVPKTLGNFVLFVCYKAVVLYVLLKVFFSILRFVSGITRCVCCCLCCCRCRRGTPATKKSAGKKSRVCQRKSSEWQGCACPQQQGSSKASGQEEVSTSQMPKTVSQVRAYFEAWTHSRPGASAPCM